MSGPELSVECGLRNRKNQAAYLLAHNSPTKSRREFLPSRSLHIYQNKLAQRVNLLRYFVRNILGQEALRLLPKMASNCEL